MGSRADPSAATKGLIKKPKVPKPVSKKQTEVVEHKPEQTHEVATGEIPKDEIAIDDSSNAGMKNQFLINQFNRKDFVNASPSLTTSVPPPYVTHTPQPMRVGHESQ